MWRVQVFRDICTGGTKNKRSGFLVTGLGGWTHACACACIHTHTMACFMGKKSLAKSHRNKANRSNFTINQIFRSNFSIDQTVQSIKIFHQSKMICVLIILLRFFMLATLTTTQKESVIVSWLRKCNAVGC